MTRLLKLNKEQKAFIPYGIGAGTGVLVPIILKKYVDGTTYPNIWQKPSIYIPIVTGIGALIIANTKLIKKANNKKALVLYGITATLAGLLAGISETSFNLSLGCSSCAQPQYRNLRNSGGHTNMPGAPNMLPSNFSPDYWTDYYYPGFQGQFLNRPQSRARGWGSDVTRNPMAAIPTMIHPNEIIA